jgi:MtN3 and saliva related transmembrane protein
LQQKVKFATMPQFIIRKMIDIISYIAAILTTISFVPQALKTIKTRDTSGISLLMYCLFVSGVFLWGVYGFLINNLAILIANIVTIILSGTILVLKLKNVIDAR